MNPSTLKGRSLLTWIDFTPEEIRYFLDLSKKVKEEAKKEFINRDFVARPLPCFLKSGLHVHVVRLKLLLEKREAIQYFFLAKIFN